MNIRRIEILIDKYFEGQTSLDEEKELKDFLLKEDVPHTYRWLKNYFIYTDDAAKVMALSDAFDEKLISRLQQSEQKGKSTARKLYIYVASGVAASILIILGLFTLVDRVTESIDPNMQEAEVAYQQASKALMFVSSKLTSGVEQTKPMRKLDENISKMEKINMYNKGVQELSEISKLTETPKRILTNK